MTTSDQAGADLEVARHAIRRAAFLTSGAGIAFGILVIVGWYFLRQARDALLESGDPYAYSTQSLNGATVASLYLLPLAAILFLWFTVALRGWIRTTQQRRNMLISDLQLVSGVVFVALFLVGAAAAASTVVIAESDTDSVSVETLHAIASFGFTLMYSMGVRIAAVFVIATASLGMTTGVLPRWFNVLSYAFGIALMLTPIVHDVLILAFPAWVIVLSAMLLYHIVNLPDDQIPGFGSGIERGGANGEAAPEVID